MFDLSWTEMLVVAAIAIIVVGPKDLPKALRTIGRWVGKAKRMARDFQNQFNDVLREAEIDTIKKEIETVGKIDPVADLRKDVAEIKDGMKLETDAKDAPHHPDAPQAPSFAKSDSASGDAPELPLEAEQDRETADGGAASDAASQPPDRVVQATSTADAKS